MCKRVFFPHSRALLTPPCVRNGGRTFTTGIGAASTTGVLARRVDSSHARWCSPSSSLELNHEYDCTGCGGCDSVAKVGGECVCVVCCVAGDGSGTGVGGRCDGRCCCGCVSCVAGDGFGRC